MSFVSATARFNHIKYLNLYSLINPYPLLRSYLNLNIFGKPVNVLLVSTVFAALVLIFFSAMGFRYFIKKRPLENTDKSISPKLRSDKIHGSLRFFEWKKLLSINKAALILVLFLAFQGYSVYTQTNYSSYEDQYYKYYMDMLEGTLTEEKEELILSEQAKIEAAQRSLDKLSKQRMNDEISMQEYVTLQQPHARLLDTSQSFSLIYQKYLYVKDNPGAEFFFDRGYERLFGITDSDFSLTSSLWMTIIIALCLCGIFSVEYKNSVYKVLNATRFGISKTRRYKLVIAAVVASAVCLMAYLPDVIYIYRFYSFNNLNAGLLNFSELSVFGKTPIWVYMAIQFLMRVVVAISLGLIVSALSLLTKNNITAMMIFSVAFVVPMLLYLAGIEFMKNLSVLPLITGTELINSSTTAICALQLVLLLLIAAVSVGYTKKAFGKAPH